MKDKIRDLYKEMKLTGLSHCDVLNMIGNTLDEAKAKENGDVSGYPLRGEKNEN